MYNFKDPNAPAGAGGVTNEQAEQLEGAKAQEGAILRSYKHGQTNAAIQRGKNTFVDKNLEGQTIKFGTGGEWTFDTGIAWGNKQTLAAAIAVGDQMGDAARGIKQALQEWGLTDDLIDVESQDQNEQILRQLYGDETYGAAAKTGAVIGAVVEPLGLLLPIGKAKSVGTAFTAAAAMGGLYGASLYVDGNESRLTNAAWSAAIMGPVGGLANKYLRHAQGAEVNGRIDVARGLDAAEQEAATYAKWSANSKARGKAGNIGMGEQIGRTDVGLEGRVYDDWFDQQVAATKVDETGTPLDWFDSQVGALDTPGKKKAAAKQKASRKKAIKKRMDTMSKKEAKALDDADVVEGIEIKAAMEGKKYGIMQQSKDLVDRAIRPIYDVVAKHSTKVAAQLRKADGKTHLLQHQWSTTVKPFTTWMSKLKGAEAETLHKLMINGGLNKATMSFIRNTGGAGIENQAKAAREILSQIMKRYKDVGYKMNATPDYFPRSVKDLEGLSKKQQGAIDKLVAKEQARNKGKALSQNQKAHIAEHYFSFDQRYSRTSGSLKSRKVPTVKDDSLKFYHQPADSLQFYIHTAADDIAKREFFKSFGYKPGKKGLDVTGTDVDKSIDSLIERIKHDVPGKREQSELVNSLRARFSADVHKTHKFVQGIKNLSYSGTLGNYWSAATQVGDLVFAVHKYGIADAVSSIFGARVTSRAELGIEKAMAELHSSTRGITSKLADWSFKWSGFDKIDRFGKNVNINASLRHNKKLATKNPTKFMKKWEPMFGDETTALMNDVKHIELTRGNTNVTDNMHLMLWNDLAETQPIGLAEMPEAYLRMPNGRIMYAYKTFAMKQLNYMRNTIMQNPNKFKGAVDLTYFATAFVLANGSIDLFKAFMSGKDMDFNDTAFDNLVSLAGTSKYAVDKSQGLGGIIVQGLAPVPLTQLAEGADKLSRGDVGGADLVGQLPIVGKMSKEWLQ